MKTPSILVIGGGYLGSVIETYFQKAGFTIKVMDFPSVNITELASINNAISVSSPDLLINCAAFTNTAEAEKAENQAQVFALNVQGPTNIQLACRQHQIPWIHFSTAMMFDGTRTDGQGWDETDIPNPTNYYSWTKAWADFALMPFLQEDRISIFRIHTPISAIAHPRNFLDRLRKFDKAIEVKSSMTVVEDMLAIILKLQEKKEYGLFNMVNKGQISAFEITKMLQELGLTDKEKVLTPMTRQELDELTIKNSGAHQTFPVLNIKKIEDHGLNMPEISDSIRNILQNPESFSL